MAHAGYAIRAMRQEMGLSGRDLAQRAGVDRAYLSRVERGERNPSPHWLRSVTDALAAAAEPKGEAS